jgi:hypothetical protein
MIGLLAQSLLLFDEIGLLVKRKHFSIDSFLASGLARFGGHANKKLRIVARYFFRTAPLPEFSSDAAAAPELPFPSVGSIISIA